MTWLLRFIRQQLLYRDVSLTEMRQRMWKAQARASVDDGRWPMLKRGEFTAPDARYAPMNGQPRKPRSLREWLEQHGRMVA